MNQHKTSLERAFEIASSGSVSSKSELCKQLKAEGYSVAQIQGPSLNAQLRELISKATGLPQR
jgi:arginine repressor